MTAPAISEVTQRSGIRWSAARAFLPPQVRKRPNLRIIDRAQVTRLVLEGGRVVGIEYEREGRVSTARAARQVVMAAGAIGTPQILMLSGLGPAAQLKEHGIEVLHDMPGVGANLQDHLADQDVVPDQWRTHAERHAGEPLGQGADRRAICRVAVRADGDVSEPAWGCSHARTRATRRRTSSSTSSPCRSMLSASRCIPIPP